MNKNHHLRILKYSCLLAILMACTACAGSPATSFIQTAEYIQSNPISTPEFIASIGYREDICGDGYIYIVIYQGALWEPDNDATELQHHIGQNTQLSINGTTTAPPGALVVSMLGMDNGIPTDRFNAPIEFCFPLDNLTPGTYLARIDTSTMSGEELSYTWALQIE